MPASHIKLLVPVLDLVHIPGTLRALDELECHAQYDVEIQVQPNFPQQSISPADQKALDDILEQSNKLLAQVRNISIAPPE